MTLCVCVPVGDLHNRPLKLLYINKFNICKSESVRDFQNRQLNRFYTNKSQSSLYIPLLNKSKGMYKHGIHNNEIISLL